LSTIHGRHECKDKDQTISIPVIQSKKAACGRFSKQLLDIGDGKVTKEWKSYKYIDTVCDATEAVYYSTEFFNSLDLRGKVILTHHGYATARD
jgi:hypothetical protein